MLLCLASQRLSLGTMARKFQVPAQAIRTFKLLHRCCSRASVRTCAQQQRQLHRLLYVRLTDWMTLGLPAGGQLYSTSTVKRRERATPAAAAGAQAICLCRFPGHVQTISKLCADRSFELEKLFSIEAVRSRATIPSHPQAQTKTQESKRRVDGQYSVAAEMQEGTFALGSLLLALGG
jgi:hypothetical protein